MAARDGVLLTGATGVLGTYLLRDLLLSGRRTAVLVRDLPGRSAPDRLAEQTDFWREALGRALPQPRVLSGELTATGLGLSLADLRWLVRHCHSVLHAAASLSFRATEDGEPWRTNVEGTAALMGLCRRLGIARIHHVSTAFVCGRRTGLIRETDIDCGQDFHNPYEESKLHAEQMLCRAKHLRATVYRPAVIVGDSQTGRTGGYSGLYRVLHVGARLLQPAPGRDAPVLRLPLTGSEPCNLVPVDWVSRAIVELLSRPRWHGRTFHLTSPMPATAGLVCRTAAEVLQLDGIRLCGPAGVPAPSRLEELFWQGVQEYWPYLGEHPTFDCANTRRALPHLPAPVMDRDLFARLVRFAVADGWGRRDRQVATGPVRDCADYIERVFPAQARRSQLARTVGLDVAINLDVRGEGGGQWSCEWRKGELQSVLRGLCDRAIATYRMDASTFEDIVTGRIAPQHAFFEQRLSVTGDVETALKLAVLFGHFLQEAPAPWHARTEATDACPPTRPLRR
jgi:thioester reductase-like protein